MQTSHLTMECCVQKRPEGVFVSKDALPDFDHWDIVVKPQEIIIRTPRRSREEVARSILARREIIKQEAGVFPDCTEIIREFRESR